MKKTSLSSKLCIASVTSAIAGIVSIFDTDSALFIVLPVLAYVLGESYAEAGARTVAEENKARKDISDQVIDSVIKNLNNKEN